MTQPEMNNSFADMLGNLRVNTKQFNFIRPDNTIVKSIFAGGKLEKQSKTGLFYNMRYLFLISPGVIKYRNEEPKEKLNETNHILYDWKKHQRMDEVERFTVNDKNIEIHFRNQTKSWSWVFRTTTLKQANIWRKALTRALQVLKLPSEIMINQNVLSSQSPFVSPQKIHPKNKQNINQSKIIHPKSAQEIFQEMYSKIQQQTNRKMQQDSIKLTLFKRDPLYQLLTSSQQIFLINFQKEAIKYFKKLVDDSEVDPSDTLKFDVQFYSSLQKQDFDNLSYMYQKTYNLGIIRVIPSILLSYKGVKALIRYKIQYPKITNKNTGIAAQLKNLQDRTRIQAPNFQNSQQKTVLQYYEIDICFFKKFIKVQHQSNSLYIINSLMGYIPVGEVPITSQLLKKKNFVGHVLDPQNLQTSFIQDIMDNCVQQFLQKIDKMSTLVSNSLQFNKMIIKNGLSRFHLPQLYQQSSLDYTKSICLSEMVILLISEILCESLSNSQFLDKNDLAVDLLNLLIGNTKQSQVFWNELIADKVQKRFGILYKEKQINIQYILAGVIQHNGILINYQKLMENRGAVPSEYIKLDFVEGFKILHRGYPISFNDKYTKIQQLVSSNTQESFTQLVQYLSLKNKQLPEWVVQSSLHQQIILLLATYIPPTYCSSQQFHHLSLYQHKYFNPVTNFDFQLLKIQLQWLEKQQKKTQFQLLVQSFLERLTFWIGDYSPMHGELYLKIASFSIKRCNFRDANAFIQSAIMNYIHVQGMFSLKLADCYMMLAKSQQDSTQSIYSYERAKKLFENSQIEESLSYLVILTELAHLYLQRGIYQKSIYLSREGINIAQKLDNTDKLIECCQILVKNYIKTKDSERLQQLQTHALMLLQKLQERQLFIRVLRLCITIQMSKQSLVSKSYLQDIVNHTKVQHSARDYQQSISYLMENRKQVQTFLQNLSSDQYISSLTQQYTMSVYQPKTMIYHVLQLFGEKIIYEVL